MGRKSNSISRRTIQKACSKNNRCISNFYTRFEASNKQNQPKVRLLNGSGDVPNLLKKAFKRVNTKKAAGPHVSVGGSSNFVPTD